MASGFSNYAEAIALDWFLKGNSGNYTPPSAVYLGIVSSSGTADELEAGTLTNEITGYDGNRPQVTFGTIQQDTDGTSYVQNTADIEFQNMPTCVVKFFIVTDTATKGQGHILFWGELDSPRTIANAGDTLKVPAGALKVKVT